MISFEVPGAPATQGSHRVRRIARGKRRGQAVVVADNPALYSFRAAVAALAQAARRGAGIAEPLAGPARLTVCFRLARPKRSPRALPCVRPDLDKLVRAVLDALSGVLYRDDGQVVELIASKSYAAAPGTRISLEPVRA